MRTRFLLLFSVFLVFIINSCGTNNGDEFSIDYEKYELANGLNVILHQDNSDPIVSMAVQYHVGSNREEQGRTGFAHLFEHMMFQESQHVGQDQFFKKIQNAGGTLNGGTWEDGTIYFQVVPKNALEMVMWMESDRMGFLLSTVTQEAFMNQQEVVQNEKRQRVDNQPYGHTGYVINKLLYPPDHPYNWQVIGSLEDLANATLQDVHDFYKKWYGPNNATIVIAGDINPDDVKQLVEKYFGEIPSSSKVELPKAMPIELNETKKAYYEDNFAKSPELNMVFPTVENYSKESYALNMFGELFSDGKKAPLYNVIVEEKKLAPSVSGYQSSNELAGVFQVRVRAFPNTNLTEVENAVFEAFEKFEKDGFTEDDLKRIKAKTETQFYNGISSILGKSFQLAMYNEYAGSPDFITQDLKNIQSVTSEDIWNAYNKYIKGKNYVMTSFVPKGQTDLIAENSEAYLIEEEDISNSFGAESTAEEIKVEEIPSAFDRSIEPEKGPDPQLNLPTIWNDELANGMKIYGITNDEIPLVNFSITMKGGLLLDDINKVGAANLLSDLMMEGTKNKTPLELEEAIDMLGANISIYTTDESIVLQANCLKSKIDEVYKLAEEILLEPRWDVKEYERLKSETIETINRRKASASSIASIVFNKLLYGDQNILSKSTMGTVESVSEISINDLKNYYEKNFSPTVANISVVGDISKDQAAGLFNNLAGKWEVKDVTFPDFVKPEELTNSQVYFVDMPNAKQSEIRIGYLALTYDDPDYYPATVMNYKLGGSFSGIVNLILREEKGYTYGARTAFNGSIYPGPFVASSAVQSNATYESVEIFRDEIANYTEGISEEDLEFTKNALLKSNARRFETLGALLGMLNNIAKYDLPFDYIKQEENVVRNMTLEQHKELAKKYLDPERMYYLVVGDAATQMNQLSNLGFGNPVELDSDGNRIMDTHVSVK
ncbi:MAG: insulinase family protein [Melioribacteraceae bacterium]|nr:insulinase family protein [Melioribacteraceae bacterium]MCF8353220.1 insulinase family protein [Melioribacteraceae bacterium]MCF8395611.1 insulinase family protein [Melioribacteraceae bacterium]MCF8418746.1 insulinase family protein [Melioribacteraceae bacterium]